MLRLKNCLSALSVGSLQSVVVIHLKMRKRSLTVLISITLFLQILFGGASSGGLGMLANIDFIQKLVKPAEVKRACLQTLHMYLHHMQSGSIHFVALAIFFYVAFQIRGYNDGGWFTLYPNFGETSDAGPPYFFKVLGYVSNGYFVVFLFCSINHLWTFPCCCCCLGLY